MIYTSLFKQSPWYEPCGMQFLAILIVSCPFLVMIGIGQIILGKFISISNAAKAFPFLACAGLGFPVLADGSLGTGMQIAGLVIGGGIIIIAIALVTHDLLRLRRTAQTPPDIPRA